jgi:hypothetical protein
VSRDYGDPFYLSARAEVLARAEACYWCGLPEYENDPFQADHLSDFELVAAHRSCNARRGAAASNGREVLC